MPRKPGSTQPYLNHDTLTQAQQAKHLGTREEVVLNLGHPVPVSRLPDNPVGYPRDYEQGPANQVINEKRSQGVYQRFSDPKDGRSTAENLAKWSGYAHSNSYDGKDPKGRGAGSDNHLLKPKGGYDYGSDTGEARLQKREKY